jgi:hypothetical protein
MEWAPMLVDGNKFGTALQRLVDLFNLIKKIEWDHLMPLLEIVALACCGTDTSQKCRQYTLHMLNAAEVSRNNQEVGGGVVVSALGCYVEDNSQSLRSLPLVSPPE